MIKNLILLTGDDDFRLVERLKFYKKAFMGKYPDGEIEEFDGKSDFNSFEGAVLTPNLFGSKRLIICEDFWSPEYFEKAQKTKFFERLPDFEDTCSILCVSPGLDKRKKASKFLLANARVENFELLSENQIWKWVEDFTAKNKGIISHSNTKILIRRCGESLWNLSREIEKLISASDNGEISKELIEELTIPHPKVIIWSFLESLSQKNTIQTMKYFRQLCMMGESVHQIFAMLIREIRIHSQLRSGLNQNLPSKEIATQAALHPFVVQKTINLSRNFSMNQLSNLYDELFNIDLGIKTGRISLSTDDQSELELAIERFILNATNS